MSGNKSGKTEKVIMVPRGKWTYICYAMCVLFIVMAIDGILKGSATVTTCFLMAAGIFIWPWYNVNTSGQYGGVPGKPVKLGKKNKE